MSFLHHTEGVVMKQRKLAFAIATAMLAAPLGGAMAQSTDLDSDSWWQSRKHRSFEPGFYVGGGVGYFRVNKNDFFPNGDKLDDDRVSLKGFVGADILPWLGAEGGYVNFGKIGDSSTFKADGWSLAAIAQAPMGNFAPYLKAGYYWWDADRDTQGATETDKKHGHDWFGGAGLRFALTEFLDMRVEYERYRLNKADIDMGSLNLQFTF